MVVTPVKTGVQQSLPGFRVKPGMTGKALH